MLFYKDGFTFSIPAYPTDKVIDPTGAGDTFAGGFMGYLTTVKRITGKALKKAVTYGIVLASFNVEGFGVERSSRVTLGDIEARRKHFRQVACF